MIRGIYNHAVAFTCIDGELHSLFWFLCGVLQGCPASAFLFNALDPFLAMLQEHVINKKLGILRACADDLGAALAQLRFLSTMAPTFQLAQSLAGLTLKPCKCIIIPLLKFSDVLVYRFNDWLAVHLASWSEFSIRDAAKYLGFYLGPAANKYQWLNPLQKF